MKVRLHDWYFTSCSCCGPESGVDLWVDGKEVGTFYDSAAALKHLVESVLGIEIEETEDIDYSHPDDYPEEDEE